MNRREAVEFVNMCMIKNGDKVLVQDRVSPDWSDHFQTPTLWYQKLV